MTDVVVHTEVKRLQKEVETLKQNLIEARQEIADVQTAAAGSVIKSVQRGVVTLRNGVNEDIFQVSEVDISKSILNLVGSGVYMPNTSGYVSTVIVNLQDETTVKAKRTYSGYTAGDLMFSFELLEFH